MGDPRCCASCVARYEDITAHGSFWAYRDVLEEYPVFLGRGNRLWPLRSYAGISCQGHVPSVHVIARDRTRQGGVAQIFNMMRHLNSSTSAPGTASMLCLLFFAVPWSLSSQTVGFSLSLDMNEAAGDQSVSSLDLLPDHPFSIQIFGAEIQDATGISARLRFDASQVTYEGFDPGDVLPGGQVVVQQDTTSVQVGVSTLSGSASVNTGYVGTLRFRTTAAFSDTEIWLVDAALTRGGQTETISPAIGVTLQIAAAPSPDFDGNGLVGFSDFVAFAGSFGSQRGDSKFDARYDLNGDGGIGFDDYLVFASRFGEEANRAPVFGAVPPVRRTVAENTAAGEPIGDPVTATDADGDSLTYRLRGVHADSFAIEAGTGQLLTREGVVYDHEARDAYSVTVWASDGQGGRATIVVGIMVTDVDEPPTTAPDSVAVASLDSALSVTWLAAMDEAGKPPVSGYEVGHKQAEAEAWPEELLLVERRADTGVTIPGLTNEQAYHVRVRTMNEEGGSPWSETVAGAPTAGPRPRGVVRDLRVDVDSVAQVYLARLFTRPALGTLTYDASSSNEGVATVTVSDTLAAVRGVRAGRATLTATARDVHGNSAQTTFFVIVTGTGPPPGSGGGGGAGPVGPFVPPTPPQPPQRPTPPQPPQTPANNRAPTFVDGSTTSRSVPENTPARQPIQHPVRATDLDQHQLTYTLSGPDSERFALDTDTGQLRTRPGVIYNHEAADHHSVTLKADDSNGGTATIDVTIHVTDVDEPPARPPAPRLTVPDTGSPAIIVSPDPEPPANTGPRITLWEIQHRSGNTGEFNIYNPDPEPDWSKSDWEATITGLNRDATYEVQVRARNDEGESGWSPSAEATISNQSPIAEGSIQDISLPVGGLTEIVSVDGTFRDPDDDGMTYTATSSNAAAASVKVMNTNVLVQPLSADTVDITVTATDPWGASGSTTFTASVQAPALSALTVSISGDRVTFEFTDDFNANETRAYRFRIRQKEPTGSWATGCFTETNDENSAKTVMVAVEDEVSDFFMSGTTYEADFGYLGTNCNADLTGVRSAAAEARAAGTSSFDIELVFVSSVPAEYRSAFETAARRWEQIIIGEVPNHDLSSAARAVLEYLYPGTTSPTVVDDLLIYVETPAIDGVGGALAAARRLVWRVPSSLPVASGIRLDRNDLDAMTDQKRSAVILHEIGHALGFGLESWTDLNLLKNASLDSDNTPITPALDTYFAGKKAISAFNAAGGSTYSGKKVPVENSGGAGSRDSHWRESVFANELMTSTVNSNVTQPLSAITIQSLADIGYGVDSLQADSYTLPSSSSKIAIESDGLNLLNCVETHPLAGPDEPDPKILNLRKAGGHE